MENGIMSNSSRSFSGGSANTSGANKGRSGSDGEGSTQPVMRIAPTSGPTAENKPVAEPLTPFEMTQMVQKIGSVVYSLQNIISEIYKSLDNPSIKDHQKEHLIDVINDLRPLAQKVFKSGMKLSGAFLPSKTKRLK
jgi:hypothetical protein